MILTTKNSNSELMTFGEHLDVLRKMLFRIVAIVLISSCLVFCFKEKTFELLLAPHDSGFVTFGLIERLLNSIGIDFKFESYDIPLISTELSAQFMAHITVSCIIGALLSSPFILYELFRFVSPALYESEKRHSMLVAGIIYLMFILGLLMSYFILFPISFQFLATYQVDSGITNTITIDSYISTFTTLTFMMGIVFQLPIFAYILGKMGFLDANMLIHYRSYAFVAIMIISAIITPPDIFTLIMVAGPVYGLYELSIFVLKKLKRHRLTVITDPNTFI